MGFDIDGNFLHTLLFPDHQVLLASDTYDIEYRIRKILEVFDETRFKKIFKHKYLSVDLNLVRNVGKLCQEYPHLRSENIK